jgi:uncharacterized membrane protein
MTLLREMLLFLHLSAAALWIGGMATMVVAVRPALPLIEAPPQRVRYIAAVFGRLFAAVAVAIAVLFASGLLIVVGSGGFARAPWSVHAMFAVALVMAGIFAAIRFGPYARLCRAVRGEQWAGAAAPLAAIRRLIGVNLVLGVLVFAVATMGRAF